MINDAGIAQLEEQLTCNEKVVGPTPSLGSRKEYMRNYQRVWIAKRRADYFENRCCEKCGSVDSLEIHHRDPNLKEDNHIWSWSKERRDKELLKCDILCNTCHKE